ncbi:MAG: MBL fold metallo-hydrolase [Chloroflexi bacterium]|nr:MBL fold metallo-hydrolase [Chloroflexota bacterium]
MIQLHILHAGYCTCPEHIAIRGGSRTHIRFPAMFALIEHPRHGAMLFDTGYSYRFFDATSKLPYSLYRHATPVTLTEADLAVNQLLTFNLRPRDISRVFISHFHADHVAALTDFDRARSVYLPHAFDSVRFTRGLSAVRRAYLPSLIPSDFDSRAAPVDMSRPVHLPPEYAPFTRGYDLLGDESILAVELPGHAHGQMGIFVRDDSQTYFFVADAAWQGRSIRENRLPHLITNLLFPDPKAYRETLGALHSFHQLHPSVKVIPSHCESTLRECVAPPRAESIRP